MAPPDCRGAGLRRCAVTDAGGCLFPPLSNPRRVCAGLLPHHIPRCPPRGLGLRAGSVARITPPDCRRAGPPRRAGAAAASSQSGLRRVSVGLRPGSIPGGPPHGPGPHAGTAARIGPSNCHSTGPDGPGSHRPQPASELIAGGAETVTARPTPSREISCRLRPRRRFGTPLA